MSERYFVVNMVRREETRLKRFQSASTHRFLQYVCANRYRLVRGAYVPITLEELNSCRDELRTKQEQGLIVVRVGHPTVGVIFSFVEESIPVESFDSKTPTAIPLEPPPPPEPVVVEAPAPVVSPPVEAPRSETPPPKDLSKMKKAALIKYAAEKLGDNTDDLKSLSRDELLELLS